MISCIIPARGGSKGIPRKNILEIAGKPLIAWSIEQARAARLVDEVWVSTDDGEIAEVSRSYGAEIWRRYQETATDTATSESAIAEWMRHMRYESNHVIVFLQATSPVRQRCDIDNAIQALLATQADSVFSARIVEGYVWKQCEGVLSAQYSRRVPRQFNSVRTLEENGSVYVFRTDVLKTYNSRLGGHIEPYVMHPLDSFQLDEPSDIPLIEQLLELRCGNHATAAN